MYTLEQSCLPASPLGADRQVAIGYTYHGDIELMFWNGTAELPTDDQRNNLRIFQMAHGSDVILLACAIGYYRRLGISSEQTR